MLGISISLTFILVIHIYIRISQALICVEGRDKVGDRFPNNDNCSSYYECECYLGELEPSDPPRDCASGTHFSVYHSNQCVHPDLALCTDQLRGLKCDAKNRLISHPTNCSRYFQCNEALRPIVQECPDHLHYSSQDGKCREVEHALCDTSLQCTIFDDPSRPTLLAHPTNCAAFYKCFNGRPIQLLCPTNLYFSEKKKYCDFPFNVDCRMGVRRNTL